MGHQSYRRYHRLYTEYLRRIRLAWAEACRHDGIDPDSQFVSFSSDNPHAEEYNRAMGEYLEWRKTPEGCKPYGAAK